MKVSSVKKRNKYQRREHRLSKKRTNHNSADSAPRSSNDLDQQQEETQEHHSGTERHYHQPKRTYSSSSTMMFQAIIKDIIIHTHFPEACEKAQYIVEEMEKARVKMEGYARETTTTARRTALIPILKANEEAVRQAKKRASWDMECEQRQVERWLQEKFEKEMEGEPSRPWRGGSEATKNGWDRPEYAISVKDIRTERKKR